MSSSFSNGSLIFPELVTLLASRILGLILHFLESFVHPWFYKRKKADKNVRFAKLEQEGGKVCVCVGGGVNFVIHFASCVRSLSR